MMLSIIFENKYDEIAKMELALALNDNIMTAEILYDFELAFMTLLKSVISKYDILTLKLSRDNDVIEYITVEEKYDK